MTIKQQGGVFGRNPTFNEVDIEGGLSLPDSVKAEFGNNSDLQIYHDGSDSFIVDSGAGNLAIRGSTSIFLQSPSGETYIKATRDAAVTLYYDNSPKLETASTGVSVTGNVIVPSGQGIDFSATSGTGTSELFDDYEEGTFTPEIDGTSTSGTYTYATQSGVYTKVGDLVTVTINLVDITESVAGSGALRITGLPFSASGTHVGSVWARSINFDNSAAYLVPYVSGSAIYINEVVDNASGGSLNVADITSGSSRLYITMTYKV